jgi:hypothetical protein
LENQQRIKKVASAKKAEEKKVKVEENKKKKLVGKKGKIEEPKFTIN